MAITDKQYESLHEDIRDMKKDVNIIFKSLHGNGKEGMKVQVDRNTQFRKTASKALWILCGVAVGLVATVVRIVIAGN